MCRCQFDSSQLAAVDFDCYFRPLEKREHRKKTAAAQKREDNDQDSEHNSERRGRHRKSINAVHTGPDDRFIDPDCLFRDDLRNIQVSIKILIARALALISCALCTFFIRCIACPTP